MTTPVRRFSDTRPRSKSSVSATLDERPSSAAKDSHLIPSSPRQATTAPSTPVITHATPPADSSIAPRKNGRRRYTPRQIPPSPYRTPQPASPPASHARVTSESDVAHFISLTQQLNGQMDGVVEYNSSGGVWESGILYIDAPSSSLNRHYGSEGYQRIIPDLRGCLVDKNHSEDGRSTLVIKVPSTTDEVVLRPPVTDVEKWFAALYRWRSVARSSSSRSLKSTTSAKSVAPSAPDTPPVARRTLDIKIGSMLLLPNRRVKAILKDNGVLSILAEAAQRGDDELLLYSIHLYTLHRSAIQLIDPSLSSHPFGFVIHARLRESGTKPYEMRKMPIYLALETRLQMEVWFVMLKCYAAPELYGPPSPDPSDSFRCHRSLTLRVVEGRRLRRPVGAGDSMREKEMDTYCEILIEGEIRGKTSVKRGSLRPLWNEDFEFSDLSEHIDDVTIQLRYIRRNRDLVLGKVSLSILETELGTVSQAWYPVVYTARDGLSVERVGDLDLKYKLEELVVLTSGDYSEIRKLLLDLKNRLTFDLAKTIQDLDVLADRLVHIYLADNMAVEWLIFLAEEEITAQFTQLKSPTTDSTESRSEDAEAHQQQTLKQEATRTLFRGNTLLTKSLMKFMEKVGRDYLEETLGPYLRYVVATSVVESCEVDPAHLKPNEDINENWARLLSHIREVWNRILASAASCPPEFKEIFSRIQEKVVETAGNIPAITFARYTCISAFIFLRFFMPACLNPSICGIIRQPPDETQRRTLLLISKGLQGVSNMSGYGGKEKWILPMGTLSAEYEDQFTAFIDQICDTTNSNGPRHPAQYSGPALVKSRLDTLSQEGIPTLPFLIDQPREYAGLVKIWNRQVFPPGLTDTKKHHSIDMAKMSEAARAFHMACVRLNIKTVNLVETAVEREEEELSENEVVEEELVPAVADINLGHSPGSFRFTKHVYRKQSFNDDEYSSSPPKRALDAVWPGFLRKRPEKKDEKERM